MQYMRRYAVTGAPKAEHLVEKGRSARQPRGDPVEELVALQGLDGAWPDVDAVLAAAGKAIRQFAELAGIKQAAKAFARIVALALLRKRYARERDVWRMIERKGLAWLAGLGPDYEGLIGRAMAAL
jgi:hypothetical protein